MDVRELLNQLRGSEAERIAHEFVKIGINGAVEDGNVDPIIVGAEAMAQGFSLMTGWSLDDARRAVGEFIIATADQLTLLPPAP
jgi:hypothetical protein